MMPKVSSTLDVLRFIKSINFFHFLERKKYPVVIQLPLTYKCNLNCVMCNIPQMDSSNELSIENLSQILTDPIFKKVTSLGINGGEPFLIKDINNYVEGIIKSVKSLKYLNVITNGTLTKRALIGCKSIYEICKKNDILFNVMISLDGYGETHDVIRGVKGVFNKTINTIEEIGNNKEMYCDNFELACTVTKYNVDKLEKLDAFVRINNWKIKYRLGIKNERIGNKSKFNDFSIETDNVFKQSAIEFFFKRFYVASRFSERFKYFAIFYYLISNSNERLLGCAWQNEGITLDSKGQIYYCAVESKKIGDMRSEKGESQFFSKENLQYRQTIIKDKCPRCIHDYNGKLRLKCAFVFLRFLLFERYWAKMYRWFK